LSWLKERQLNPGDGNEIAEVRAMVRPISFQGA